MKTQWHVYNTSMQCPLIVSGDKKLVAALAQLTNFKSPVTISARGFPTVKISAPVVYVICNNLLRNEPTIFQYLGESFIISDTDTFIHLLRAVVTERLYVGNGVIKTSATTLETALKATAW